MNNEKTSLPKWAERFLKAICPEDFREEIEGDVLQQFNRNVKVYGRRKSIVKLFITVGKYCRPGILFRHKLRARSNHFDLFKNDLHLTLRQLKRNSLFSSLNVIGLSTSLAVVFLIAQYAAFHFSFDRINENVESTYRVYNRTFEGSKLSFESALTNYNVGQAIKTHFPEATRVSQLLPTDTWFDCVLRYDSESGPRIYNERKLFFTDPSFLQIFQPRAVHGDLSKALTDPYSVVLTQRAASRYFSGENPIGKILHLNGSMEQHDYQVTAVIEDFPVNSHLDIEIMMSLTSLRNKEDIENADCYTYVQIYRNTNAQMLEEKMVKFARGLPGNGSQRFEPKLQSVKEIHLYSDLQDEIKAGADIELLYFLIVIGIIILAIAWINYVNLAMSRMVERTREVGIRKVNGASKGRLISQLVTESLVLHLIALVCAVCIVELASPWFRSLVGFDFSWKQFFAVSMFNPIFYLFFAVVFGVGVCSNYPAFLLASFNPLNVLKGDSTTRGTNRFSANALITFQFVCSIMLAISVLVIHTQYKFMQEKELGIEINRTLVVKAPTQVDATYSDRFIGFRNLIASSLFVTQITSSTAVPGQEIEWTGRVSNRADGTIRNIHIQVADTAYFHAFNVSLLSGRNFTVLDYPGDQFGRKEEPVILNEKAVDALGFLSGEDAIGRRIFWGDNACLVVGVVANYHQQSLRSDFKPILYTANGGPLMSLKVTEDFERDFQRSIMQLKEAWSKFFPDNAFDYFYLPDFYASQHRSEQNLRTVLDVFSGLALLTSCLGLLGVTAFAARRKIKEVTIRKVLGANITSIIVLLSGKFVLLISVAAFFAIPLALLQSTHWLNGYAFHIELELWHFAVPVICVVLIAGLTVLSQCWKVARESSAKLLRSE